MKSYYIHVVRSSLTTGNAEAKYIGRTDLPLSIEGAQLMRNNKIDFEYPQVEAVFTPDLKRCIQTAKLAFPDREPILIEALTEYDFGEFEGMSAEKLKENKAFGAWLRGDLNSRPPFGESNGEFAVRVCSAFEKITDGLIKTGVTQSAIVAPAGVIMTILSAYGIPEAPMNQWMMDPGFGFTLKVTPALWMRGQKVEVNGFCPFERA